MSVHSYLIEVNPENSTRQKWEDTTSSTLRWKRYKLIGAVLVTNVIGVSTVAWGVMRFLKADNDVDTCHVNLGCEHDKINHTYRCREPNDCEGKEALFGYISGVAAMALGTVVELASPLFTYIFDQGRRDLVDLASPETLLKIRDLLSKDTPRDFANEYLTKLDTLVELAIFPADEVDRFKELLNRYDRSANSPLTLNPVTDPEFDEFDNDWFEFKQRLKWKIPNPILP